MPPTTDDSATSNKSNEVNPLVFGIDRVDEVFSDVEPIPQDDGPSVVCCIDYPPNFVKVYDYFRAVLKHKEVSPRVVGLTRLCLYQNPANYTVWHVRRQCLFSLPLFTSSNDNKKEAIAAELDFTAELGGSNPKNYQIWYHRRSLLDTVAENADELRAYQESELGYVTAVFEQDGKNYHAWSHRQWFVLALKSPQVLEQELTYTAQLIRTDIRNNSAWNHRWFVIHNQPYDVNDAGSTAGSNKSHHRKLPLPVVESEAKYAMEQVQLDPYNESSCRYLVALLKEQAKASTDSPTESQQTSGQVLEALQPLATQYSDAWPVLSAIADLHELNQRHSDAKIVLTALITADPIRTKYWNWRLEQAGVNAAQT